MANLPLTLSEHSQSLLTLMHDAHSREVGQEDLTRIRDVILNERHQLLGLGLTFYELLVNTGHHVERLGERWREFCDLVEEARKLDNLADSGTKRKRTGASDDVRKAHDVSTIATYWSPEVAAHVIGDVEFRAQKVLRSIRVFATYKRDFHREALPLINGLLLRRHFITIKSDDSHVIPLFKKAALQNNEWTALQNLVTKGSYLTIEGRTMFCDERTISAWAEDTDGEVQVDEKKLGEWKAGSFPYYLLGVDAYGLLCPRHRAINPTPQAAQALSAKQPLSGITSMGTQLEGDRAPREETASMIVHCSTTNKRRRGVTRRISAPCWRDDTARPSRTSARSSDEPCRGSTLDEVPQSRSDDPVTVQADHTHLTHRRRRRDKRSCGKSSYLAASGVVKEACMTAGTRHPKEVYKTYVALGDEHQLASTTSLGNVAGLADDFAALKIWAESTKVSIPTLKECEARRDELLRKQSDLCEGIELFFAVLDEHCVEIDTSGLVNL